MTLKELEEETKRTEGDRSTALVPLHKTGDTALTIHKGGVHFIYLMDPLSGEVTRRYLGPDGHLGATEMC